MPRIHPRRANAYTSPHLSFEQLEQRQLLAADGFNFPPLIDVVSSNGKIVQIGAKDDGLIELNGDIGSFDAEGKQTLSLTLNNFEYVTVDGDTFTGSLETQRQLLESSENSVGTNALISQSREIFLISEVLGRLDSLPNVDEVAEFRFDSVTIESDHFGTVTVPRTVLYRPFVKIQDPGDQKVRFFFDVNLEITRDPLLASLIDSSQPVQLTIDFGDGSSVDRTLSDGFDLNRAIVHRYQQAGEYTITVNGLVSTSDGGTIALRETCVTVRVFECVEVTDTPGDDNIVFRNETGRLIANINGTDQDLGASDEIGQVDLILSGGNNTVDASGLLITQSLNVPLFNNSSSNVNNITGGPGNDNIFGGRGSDIINGGDGDDFINGRRGNDTINGQAGNDTITIPGGFDFGFFSQDVKQLNGGETPDDRDVLKVLDAQDDLDIFSGTTPPGVDGVLNLFKGFGSSAPEINAFLNGFEALVIDPQLQSLFVNLSNATFFEEAIITGSDENDIVNMTNSTIDTNFTAKDGNDTFIGGDGNDTAHGGPGNDDLEGNDGDDTLIDTAGTNDLDGDAGSDRFVMSGDDLEAGAVNRIEDFIGDDTIRITGFNSTTVDLNSSSQQEISPGISIDLPFGSPVENVDFQVGEGSIDISGSTDDNTFTILPSEGAIEPGPIEISDGFGGNDTLREAEVGNATPESFTPPGTSVTFSMAPGSGDVIDLPADARVTASFATSFRAVNVDLDVTGVDQVIDSNGNTLRSEHAPRNFIGSNFFDTLQIDATVDPRTASGGAGTDTVTIDAGGRPVTQSVDAGVTTVEVAGYAPIEVSEFETITIANQGAAGGLTLDMSAGNDDALLQLNSIVSDGTDTVGNFTLSEATDAFTEEQFLHSDNITEINSDGGTDSLTIDVLGQPFEIVGSDIIIGELAALRLVGFTEVTIRDGTLPGDYNGDRIVDIADYSVWRNNLGAAAGTLPNDIDGGTIGTAQYNTWRANYGGAPADELLQLTPPVAALNASPNSATIIPAIDSAFASLEGQQTESARTIESTDSSPAPTINEELLLLPLTAGNDNTIDAVDTSFAEEEEEAGDPLSDGLTSLLASR